jgi:hypothetical protein
MIQFFQMKKFLISETKDVCITGIKLSQSFKWKWPKSFAGSWQHQLGTDMENSKNGVPSLSFLIFFSTRLLSACNSCDACLYTFGFSKPYFFYNFQKFLCMQLKFGGRGGLKITLVQT